LSAISAARLTTKKFHCTCEILTIADTILATNRYLDCAANRLVRRRNEVGMSTTDQYRLNAADFLSRASKAGDSCQVSHFIDMALYWFNMAEKVERGARIVLSDTALAA
jgi:hypothetical protein